MHRLWNPFEEERNQGVWSGRYQLQRQRLLQERFEVVIGLLVVELLIVIRFLVELLIVGFVEFFFRLIVEFVVVFFVFFVLVVRLAPNNEHPSGA